MSDASRRLPEEFSHLERFSDWCLPTERERQYKRLGSDMGELREFYEAMFPRMEELVSYLNPLPLDALSDEAQNLLNLCLSVVEVSNAVEMFGQPGVIDGFDPERFIPIE